MWAFPVGLPTGPEYGSVPVGETDPPYGLEPVGAPGCDVRDEDGCDTARALIIDEARP